MPVTVTEWNVAASPGGMAFRPVADSIGPPLPHRLDPGTSEVWAMDAGTVRSLAESAAKVRGTSPGATTITATVGLGDGRMVTAAGSLRV